MTDSIKDSVTNAVSTALLDDAIGKKWYVSKTFWINIIAVATILAQTKYGFIFDASSQALALSVINLFLRKITKEPIVF